MKERDLLRDVMQTARRFGWRAFHVPMPVRPIPGGKYVPEPNARGIPDLILLHDDPPRLIFAEVKGAGGRVALEQREFLRLVNAVGAIAPDHPPSFIDLSKPHAVVKGYLWTLDDVDAYTEILKSKVLA